MRGRLGRAVVRREVRRFCRAFRALSREASYLMIPGLLWMLFFWANNFAIWNLSGGPLASYLGS